MKAYQNLNITGSINVTGSGITGSLSGNATSANTASYVNILTQNVTVSGSVHISGSLLINGQEAGQGGASVVISGSAPSGSQTGSMWFNNDDLNLYIRYFDGTSSYWVPSYNNQSLYANSASFASTASLAVTASHARTASFANNFTVSGSFIALSGSAFASTASFTSQVTIHDLYVTNKIQHATSPKPSAPYGVAFGNNTMVSGAYGVSVGSNNFISASAQAAFVAGQYNTASTQLQTVVGQFNAPNNTAGAFIVGGGTGPESGSRKNAAVFTTSSITLSGSVLISGSLLLNGAEVGGRGATVTITGSIPSGSANSGSLWWNENDGNLYIQVAGPTGSTYVPATNTVAGGNYGATLVTARTGSVWNINHNLNSTTPLVIVYSGSNVMIPADILSIDANNTRITFSGSVNGTAVLSTGIGNATTNNAVSASFATTASLTVNATSASLATSSSFARSASFAVTASALSGSAPVYLSVVKGTTQSIPFQVETTVTDWNSTIVNTVPAAWTSSTGTWTCPRTGLYDVSFAAMLEAVAPTDLNNREFAPIINHTFISGGGTIYIGNYWAITTTSHRTPLSTVRMVLAISQGDTIRPRIYQNLRDNTAVNMTGGRNHFIITELPNRIQK